MYSRSERIDNPFYREIAFERYGTYVVTDTTAYALLDKRDIGLENSNNVVLISQPDWESTFDVLESSNFGKTIVLTPELITVAGMPFGQIREHRNEIQNSLSEVSVLSKLQPEVSFVIGSPFFSEGKMKPYNSAVVVKNGRVEAIARKRLLDNHERNFFDFEPQDAPTVVDGSTLLVCRDLIGASKTRLYIKGNVPSYVVRSTGDEDLASRYVNTEFIGPETNRILVSSCWGVGMPESFKNMPGKNLTEAGVNSFYKFNLDMISAGLLNHDRTLSQIIICDRAPTGEGDIFVANKPMTVVYFRS